MRVISGTRKGIVLKAPDGNVTRPTTDRIKESLFSMIQFELKDKICLDAFSGTGALGIEAISRGARFCYLVEKNKKSCNVIKFNIEKVKLEKDIKLLNMDIFDAIKFFHKEKILFDIIFLDPPYNKGLVEQFIKEIKEYPILNNNCKIIVEEDIHNILKNDIECENISLLKSKKYSNTIINIYEYVML